MSVVTSTTLEALEAAMVATITGMAPTHTAQGDATWVYAADHRALTGTMVPRLFAMEWSGPATVLGGATGNGDSEVSIDLAIAVDYRAFPAEDRAWVAIDADHWDVHDALADDLEPTIPGLMWIESAGVELGDSGTIRHKFKVQFQRTRRT